MPTAVLLNAADPLFNFENMMAHRQYFAVMKPLWGYSTLPYLLDPGYSTPGIPAAMWDQLHQQAHNDFNVALPSNYANGYSITPVTPPVANGQGSASGSTSLTVSGVTNSILLNSTVAGPGVPSGVTIISQLSGTPGGDGVYRTSAPLTLSSVALTFTHAPFNQANEQQGGTIGIPQSQILIEGPGSDPASQAWWTFSNFLEHYTADQAILPLPTTMPVTAGTGPGTAPVSNPWWWSEAAPVNFPFW